MYKGQRYSERCTQTISTGLHGTCSTDKDLTRPRLINQAKFIYITLYSSHNVLHNQNKMTCITIETQAQAAALLMHTVHLWPEIVQEAGP